MSQHFRRIITLAAIGSLAACARGDQDSSDTAAGTVRDTGAAMGSMASPGMGMDMPPARDADHEFLRMMAHHHEGLIQMATEAMGKGSQPATQNDAHQLHTKQAEDQKKMLAMIQAQYGDSTKPMVMPGNRAMMDSLAGKTGAEYDRVFYRQVIAHHREGIRMVDEHLPKLTKPEVRQMAERMKAEQQREIRDFERKAGT